MGVLVVLDDVLREVSLYDSHDFRVGVHVELDHVDAVVVLDVVCEYPCLLLHSSERQDAVVAEV